MVAFILERGVAGSLDGSVGLDGFNRPEDVAVVQTLLKNKNYYGESRVDGRCGTFTIEAIKKFQTKYIMQNPDGLIQPGKKTWQKLIHPNPIPRTGHPTSAIATRLAPAVASSIVYFPIAHSKIEGNITGWYTPPSQRIYRAARSWNSTNQRYGRAHAGVDIYTEEHAEVYACATGKVVEYRPAFATGRNNIPLAAIAIEHANTHIGKIVVRYCEMEAATVPEDLKTVGATVTARRIIGKTWPVAGLNDCMLHLEAYQGTGTGLLSVSGGGMLVDLTYSGRGVTQQAKTNRRDDLITPYDFLIGCMNNSPVE
jgi:peptidoglycan hydrolase-like protein with peptidoglycan-binding domain